MHANEHSNSVQSEPDATTNPFNLRVAGTIGDRRRLQRRPEDVSSDVLLSNLLTLGRDLRDAGLPLGTGQIMSLVEALGTVDPRRRNDVYWAARATLVTRPEQIPIFDAEFGRFWRRLADEAEIEDVDYLVTGETDQLDLPRAGQARDKREQRGEAGAADKERTILAIEGVEDDRDLGDGEDEEIEAPPEDVLIFSAREVLRKKDFSLCTPEEIAEARRILEGMSWKLGSRETRRRVKANLGDLVDPRSTLRRSLRYGGVPIDLRHRKPKRRQRPLILICDISGSMDRYSRLLLRFVHAIEHGLDSVEVFVFGTRLTRITRALRKRDVDSAIADVVHAVDDWSGGTRIGEAIKSFNYLWSRRVLRSGATVVVISDGWDRGDPDLLAEEMARLQRSSRRLIWLNPLLGAPGYQPLTQGIRAALPYVDEFLPIHNLQSMEALARLLAAVEDRPPIRATSRQPSAVSRQLSTT